MGHTRFELDEEKNFKLKRYLYTVSYYLLVIASNRFFRIAERKTTGMDLWILNQLFLIMPFSNPGSYHSR